MVISLKKWTCRLYSSCHFLSLKLCILLKLNFLENKKLSKLQSISCLQMFWQSMESGYQHSGSCIYEFFISFCFTFYFAQIWSDANNQNMKLMIEKKDVGAEQNCSRTQVNPIFLWVTWNLPVSYLTLKHRETHGCLVSTVATDALVLKHQAISIHNAD